MTKFYSRKRWSVHIFPGAPGNTFSRHFPALGETLGKADAHSLLKCSSQDGDFQNSHEFRKSFIPKLGCCRNAVIVHSTNYIFSLRGLNEVGRSKTSLSEGRLPKGQEWIICLEGWKCFLNYKVPQNSRSCNSITHVFCLWRQETIYDWGSYTPSRNSTSEGVACSRRDPTFVNGSVTSSAHALGRWSRPAEYLDCGPLGTITRKDCNQLVRLELKHMPLW